MADPTETARRVLDLDKQATQGPWRWDPKRGTYEYNAQNVGGFVAGGAAVCHFGNSEQYYPEQGEPPNEADRALIAEYRTAAPDLARALLESQAALAAAEEGRLAALDIAKGAYEERDEARAALAAANSRADLAYEEKALADREFVASQKIVRDLVETLQWCRHTISNANDILRDEDEEDTAEVDAALVEIDALLAKHAAPAPTPAAVPGLVFGEPDAEGDREAKAVDGGHYEVCTSEERPGQWFWTGPKMIGLAYVATEAEAIAAANAHNAARLAKKGGE